MLTIGRALLMLVDVQGKLADSMFERPALFRNLQILIRGVQVLGLPIIWVEQNPTGLGPTVPEIANLLAGQTPISKTSFSACGEPAVMDALRHSRRTQILLAGIEAHVCVYLTAADLLAHGYEVEVPADAVSSRSADNKRIGLQKIGALQGAITCAETALFELLGRAEGPQFKEILKLVK